MPGVGSTSIDMTALQAQIAAKADASAVTTALAAKADTAAIPQPAMATPMAEANGGNPGTDASQFAQKGHQHPRLTSVTYATIATGSTVTVTLTRSFASKPGMLFAEVEGDTSASAQPAVFKVQSWVQDAGSNYTGAVIRAWRSQTVPQNLVTLLLSAIFNLFGATVVGTQFSVTAVARSDV